MNYQKCNKCGMPKVIGPLITCTIRGEKVLLCELCKMMIEKGEWKYEKRA